MRAEYQFTVPAPADLVWMLFTDRDSVLGCVPGLAVTEITPRACEGTLRLRVRSTTATYRGTAQLTSRDDDARVLTAQVEGTQLRGSGTLKADVEITLASANGSGTVVAVGTEFAVTGPLADSGGSAIEGAVGRLLSRFEVNVLEALTVETGLPAADAASSAAPGSIAPILDPAQAPEPDHPQVFEVTALPGRTRRVRTRSLSTTGLVVAVAAAAAVVAVAIRRFHRSR